MHDNLYSLSNQKIGNMLLVHHPCNVFEKKNKIGQSVHSFRRMYDVGVCSTFECLCVCACLIEW